MYTVATAYQVRQKMAQIPYALGTEKRYFKSFTVLY